jgi:hypothetical protein
LVIVTVLPFDELSVKSREPLGPPPEPLPELPAEFCPPDDPALPVTLTPNPNEELIDTWVPSEL